MTGLVFKRQHPQWHRDFVEFHFVVASERTMWYSSNGDMSHKDDLYITFKVPMTSDNGWSCYTDIFL